MKYVLIAGVNGAGKSTLYQSIDSLKNMPRVNLDEIVREFGDWRKASDVMKAGKIAVNKIKEYFDNRVTFNQETTLCGNSIERNIKLAKELGYFIELHYIGVESIEVAKKRIAYRVKNGGHNIPDADIERRYYESLFKLSSIIHLCDLAVFYDNSEMINRFAIYEEGIMKIVSDEEPIWFIDWKNGKYKNKP